MPSKVSNAKVCIIIIALLLLLGVGFSLSIFLGSNPLTFHQVWEAIQEIFHKKSTSEFSYNATVIWELRFSRTILGICVGMALAIAGVLTQVFSRNILTDPSLIGISASSSFSMAFAIAILGLTKVSQYIWFGLLGAVITTICVGLISMNKSANNALTLLLIGSGITTFLTALTTLTILSHTNAIGTIRIWAVGSLANLNLNKIIPLLPIYFLGLLFAVKILPALNILALGKDTAKSLGNNLTVTYLFGMLAIVFLITAATATCGSITFVGLISAYLARFFVKTNYKLILPISALIGGSLVIYIDILSRIIIRPSELQVSLLVMLIGAILLIFLVRSKRTIIL